MLRLFLALLTVVAFWPASVVAQSNNSFAPIIFVNDRVITGFELDQRIRFLDILNAPGNLEEEAEKALIDDRLRMDAGNSFGVTVSPDVLREGMEDFAGRANLTLDQFVAELARAGVAQQTFRDFVEAGLVWRQVIGGLFGSRTQISDEEIDRALATSTRTGAARILISEIIMRADTPEFAEQAAVLANRLKNEISSPAEFAAAARQYSISPTGPRGGRVDWLDLANLPPQLASILLTLGPNEVSDPLPVGNALALFQVRDLEELETELPDTVSIEYARYVLPAGDVAKVRSKIDTCDDLYGVAKGKSEELLQRVTQSVAELDEGLALTLAKLDENETAVVDISGQTSLLMLCGRTPELSEDFDRDALRDRLRNQRIAAYADSYLAELRANAIIKRP